MADRPYTRIYHEIADDYPDVWDSPDLAALCRLMVAADQSWPSSNRWVGFATQEEVDRLAGFGLIDVKGARYRTRLVDDERDQRSESARTAALMRWHGTASAPETEPASGPVSGSMPTRPYPTLPDPNRTSPARARKDELSPISENDLPPHLRGKIA